MKGTYVPLTNRLVVGELSPLGHARRRDFGTREVVCNKILIFIVFIQNLVQHRMFLTLGFINLFYTPEGKKKKAGTGIAQWLERRTRD